MHLTPLIIDLALILCVAGIMSIIFQKIGQPVVLGYIIAGVIVGPYTPPAKLVYDIPGIQTWAELGVIFLMFTLGLEFSFRKLLDVGGTALSAAVLEVVFFLLVGYGIGRWLDWNTMDSIFLGAMLSISSTTIIIKALDDLKLKTHKFASLIFGILIVEDLFAILLIVGLTTIATTSVFSIYSLFLAAINLALVVGSWFLFGYFIIPRIVSYIAKKGNNEMLTLVSFGLCLGLVVLASRFGYSPALGAFIMGSILAETELIHRIEGLMSPLRDLFGAIFFVSIGMLIDPTIMWEYKETILLLCFVTIVGKILSTSLGAILSGQSFKNSVQVGMGLAQIGEFSFIIAGLGLTLKATTPKLYPIGVAVSLVTTFTTPYFIKYSGQMASKLESLLPRKIKILLDRYFIWTEHRKSSNKKNKDFWLLVGRWVANGILVSFIFNFTLRNLTPKISFENDTFNRWSRLVSWLITLAVSSPFIWGMIFTSKKNFFRIRKENNLFKAFVLFSFPVLTLIWIVILSTEFFSLKFLLPLMIIAAVFIYLLLYKQLESYYKWFESTFLETFKDKSEGNNPNVLPKLAPWDHHLVDIQAHPNAVLINKSLIESHLRSRFGINVVAIKRGLETIVAPLPTEKILPMDTLIVLGTDDQLDRMRPELEQPQNKTESFLSGSNYRLKHVRLSSQSPLVNLSIRASGIRENFHAMIVGIERDQSRIINPDTDFLLRTDDVLWIVGEKTSIDDLLTKLA